MIVSVFFGIIAWSVMMLEGRTLQGQEQISDASAPDKPSIALTLEQYLWEVCPSLGLQFTMEKAAPPKVQEYSPFWGNAPAEWRDKKTFFAFLQSIEKLSGYSFQIDQKHPNVIHAISSELVGMEGYALDQEIAFEFAGTLGSNMILSLRKQVGNIEASGPSSSLNGSPPGDDWTPIAVNFDKRKVRQILTDAVPLKCYETSLWGAVTQMKEGRPTTTLQYYGMAGFDDATKNWPWWEWLNVYTKEYGCLFTIEFAYRSPNDPDSCPEFFSEEEKFASIEALLEELQKRVPYLTAVRDQKRPEIIHLIDRELLKRDDYVLNQPVTIDYVGNPDGLIPAIAPQIAGIDPRRLVEDVASDEVSKITVHARNAPLRSVLTDYVPLTVYSNVIWQARTWLKPDSAVTGFRYEWLGLPTSKTILRSRVEVEAQWLRENTDMSEAEIAEHSRQLKAAIEKSILKLEKSGQVIPEK